MGATPMPTATFAGRTKDLVIRGGENVPVKEIEDVLMRHPAVGVAAIVAKPHDGLAERDLSSWKRFLCAGAAIPRPVLERATELLPDCTVMPGWGMTECGLLTVGMPDDPLERRLTDGRAVRDNEVRVVDESGAPVVDAEGDLQCRGTGLFAGYMAGREFTAPNNDCGPTGDTTHSTPTPNTTRS